MTDGVSTIIVETGPKIQTPILAMAVRAETALVTHMDLFGSART